MKTSIVVDLALSLAAAAPFLGEFAVPRRRRVCVLSGESGEASLQSLARRVAAAKGLPWPQVDCFWGFDLPQLSRLEHLAALRDALVEHKIDVLIYDPLYLGLLAGQGAKGLSAANLYQVGPLLLDVTRACLEAGCTPLLCHHFKLTRANPYAEPQLEDLAYAGVQEFARQWVLLGRRAAFDPDNPDGLHQLWLAAGGSAGHSLLRAVDVREGRLLDDFSGRTWRVEVFAPAEARVAEEEGKSSEQERKEAARDRADDAKVLAALDRLDPDRKGVTRNKLRPKTKLSGDRVSRACWRLVDEGIIEEVEIAGKRGKGAEVTTTVYRRPARTEHQPEHPDSGCSSPDDGEHPDHADCAPI
jgi:hypothetical protein